MKKKTVGKLRLPLIITGDWCIGSKDFSKPAFEQLCSDVERYKVKSLVIVGNLFQAQGYIEGFNQYF
ncbi:unnamed protein product [marine sediment metagenome]|uniref:Calcineurin-like phosphoesterase domain-containing protein n=1 Tax=marine sediment metagenome TaxID=412755 RepID=X1N6J8_9ZZZZ